jgi:hypothetical protein
MAIAKIPNTRLMQRRKIFMIIYFLVFPIYTKRNEDDPIKIRFIDDCDTIPTNVAWLKWGCGAIRMPLVAAMI